MVGDSLHSSDEGGFLHSSDASMSCHFFEVFQFFFIIYFITIMLMIVMIIVGAGTQG